MASWPGRPQRTSGRAPTAGTSIPWTGPTNFAHGYPHFAVSIALGCNGEILLGVVHDPVRAETFLATRGESTRLNDSRVGVSRTQRLEEALIATGFPYDRRDRVTVYTACLQRALEGARCVRRSGSAALDLSYVACGRLGRLLGVGPTPRGTRPRGDCSSKKPAGE
jgi:myo-inositol-1(or 4)-monophosphatase